MSSERAPAVSVIMPVYNSARFLREAIESVLAQSFGDFELIIIDDGSSDGSAEILRSFPDARIRILTHGRNLGLVASLNEGLDASKGGYIARMDADDLMHRDRLAKQFAFLEDHPEVTVLSTFVETMNADGETTGLWDTDRACTTEAEIHGMLPRTNCIAHPTVMIRRSSLGTLRYAEYQPGAEDWDLWLRMQARGLRIAKLPEALLRYRQHTTSMMSVQKHAVPLEIRLMRTRWRFLRNEWGRFRFSATTFMVLHAQLRTLARHLISNIGKPLARDLYRLLTYSPFALYAENRALRKAMNEWKGSHVFNFPRVSTGGAERVHADIVASVADRDPLVVISGFSPDRGFADRFAQSGRVLEIPRLLHHPFTRRTAHRLLEEKINALNAPVLFASLSAVFFDLLPSLNKEVKCLYLQHAFLYQPQGNLQHRRWLPRFPRVDGFLFVSKHALGEFKAFLFANNVPHSAPDRSCFIPNAVSTFVPPQDHARTGVLFVGRDSAEKRIGLFLQLTNALERARPGRFRFTVVGPAAVPGYPHVSFESLVSDEHAMSRIYAAHDLLAVTSSREGFPMVILEAMAHGLVVLSTPVGDVPNRIDGSFAYVTSSVDETVVLAEMTTNILALDSDRERLLRMKHTAFERAKQEADPGAFRDRYRALLIKPASET